MTKIKNSEKRKHPRINKSLPLNLSLKNIDCTTGTKNLSCGGAYCHIDSYIKPMTKLSIGLKLPGYEEQIFCKGVVVRTEEAAPTGYNIAIFFNDISKRNFDRLKNYIEHHTPV